MKMKNEAEMTLSLCRECKVNGVIICTATVSRGGKCNRGALSLEEARERKRLRDEGWRSYLEAISRGPRAGDGHLIEITKT